MERGEKNPYASTEHLQSTPRHVGSFNISLNNSWASSCFSTPEINLLVSVTQNAKRC